jgi:hypothetical protein
MSASTDKPAAAPVADTQIGRRPAESGRVEDDKSAERKTRSIGEI